MVGGAAPNGECSACVMSKFAGNALDRIMWSRSSEVNRLSFARLLTRQLGAPAYMPGSFDLPVLEPHLYLSRTQSWNLSRQTLAMCCIWVRLSCEFAHEESCLVVRKPSHCQSTHRSVRYE